MAIAVILKRVAVALTVSASALTLTPTPALAEPLPAVGADLSRTSVSGLSSGAYMAGQFQIAYSRLVIGAAMVAGGPYGCASDPNGAFIPFWPLALSLNLDRALNRCMNDGGFFSDPPSARQLADAARSLADKDRIDPLDGLKADKVYIFSSARDVTVEPGVVEQTAAFYAELGVPAANIAFVKHDKAAHAFIVEQGAPDCGTKGEPFLNDCDYDQAKAVLETIYGRLGAAGSEADGRFVTFDQDAFGSGLGDTGLAREGVAFVPSACASGGCAPHVVFHGCKQSRETLGDAFVKGSFYARWAGPAKAIVIFPQVQASIANPNGCWDWWGYTGRNFLEREAPQMAAVRRMLDAVARRP